MNKKQKKVFIRIIIAFALIIILKWIPVEGYVDLHCIWFRILSLAMIF